MSSPQMSSPRIKAKRPPTSKRVAKRLARAQHVLKSIASVVYDDNPLVRLDATASCYCPHCDSHMSRTEIDHGFSQDALVAETTCTECDGTFLAILKLSNGNHFVYLGPAQTRAQYQARVLTLTEAEYVSKLFDAAPHIAWSACVHSPNHGRYTNIDAATTFLEPNALPACDRCESVLGGFDVSLETGAPIGCHQCDRMLAPLPDEMRVMLKDHVFCAKRAKLE